MDRYNLIITETSSGVSAQSVSLKGVVFSWRGLVKCFNVNELGVCVAKCFDEFSPPSSPFHQVYLMVLDVNDNPPTFLQPLYSFSVLEGTAPVPLGTITAFDLDAGGCG